eukprot:SAG11_NODE_1336_length_5173_cov_10.716791_8_plen_92_part_00
MRNALLDTKQQLRYVAALWKPDLEHGIDINTDSYETRVGRLVMAAHFGVDMSEKDGAMRNTYANTRKHKGKLSLKRCKEELIKFLKQSDYR